MNVAESDIGRLRIGQEATFTVDAYPQERFRGSISAIRNAPTTIQNVVTYEAVIGVRNDDMRLKPGMTANISVVVARKDDVLLVPNLAMRFRPPDSLVGADAKEQADRRAESTGRAAGAARSDSGSQASERTAGANQNRNGTAPSDSGTQAGPTQGDASRPPNGSAPEGGSRRSERPVGKSRAPEGASGARSGRPGPGVWVLANGKPRRVPITIGITDGSVTEVVAGELLEGDPVITEMSGAGTAPARTTRPGMGRMF